MRIKGFEPIEPDEKIALVEVWYDRDCRLWVVQPKNAALADRMLRGA